MNTKDEQHRAWTAAFSRELEEWREAEGLTIRQLCDRIEYGGSSALYHHTKGKAGPDLLERLARAWPDRWTARRDELVALLNDHPIPAGGMPPLQAAALREVRAAAANLVAVIDRIDNGDSTSEGINDAGRSREGQGGPGGNREVDPGPKVVRGDDGD